MHAKVGCSLVVWLCVAIAIAILLRLIETDWGAIVLLLTAAAGVCLLVLASLNPKQPNPPKDNNEDENPRRFNVFPPP